MRRVEGLGGLRGEGLRSGFRRLGFGVEGLGLRVQGQDAQLGAAPYLVTA